MIKNKLYITKILHNYYSLLARNVTGIEEEYFIVFS